MERASEFIAYLRLDKGLSEQSIAAYLSDLTLLEEASGKSPAALTESDLRAALGQWRDEGLRTSSIQRKISSARAYFFFLRQTNPALADPTDRLELSPRKRPLPKILDGESIQKILALPNTKTDLGLRDRTLLELLYACGLRVSELTGLRVADLKLAEGVAKIRGKGGRERLVPIGSSALNWLERYLTEAYPRLNLGLVAEEIFLSRGRPMSRQEVWQLVRAYGERVGVMVSPHFFRHAFASHLLAGGMNLRSVQRLLGHQDISTTQVYTHVEAGRLIDAHRKFHPRG